jgi:CHAT domain-containing protein/lipopolysaccharide biosynthesis regulator YciM
VGGLIAGFSIAVLLALSAPATGGQDAPQPDWAALDKQAEELYTAGDLKEAVRVAKLASAAASGVKQTARSLDRLGFFEYNSGNLKDAETYLRQALDLRKVNFGIDSLDYAESAHDLALFCRDTGRLAEARELAEQATEIRSRLLPANDLVVAETLNTLGSTYAAQGDYDAAIVRLEQSRIIHESQPNKDFGEEYGTLCINLAQTYQRVGKYAQAEAITLTGLDVLRRRPGAQHPVYSVSLMGFAYLQVELGHYSAAEKLYYEAGELMREQLGERHQIYPTLLNNRAVLNIALGKLDAAEADLRKALELKRSIFGPDAGTVAASLRNLARLVYTRVPDEGEKLFQEAADIYAKSPKPLPFEYTSTLLSLANAQRRRGALAMARETLQRAADVSIKGLSTKHPLYAAVLRDLGRVHQAAGEYTQAELRLQEAVDVVRQIQGENHPDLAQYLEALASVYDETGNYETAVTLYRRGLEISDRTVTEMLTIGSDKDKTALLTNQDDPIPMLLAFQQRAGDRVPAARALAFEEVARRKGRMLEQTQAWEQSLRENPDTSVRNRFAQWQAMLECQASLTIALGYRDLKPAMVGTCALTGTELEAKYERLLNDLRTSWTNTLGQQAIQALDAVKQRMATLEAGLSREVPRFASAIKAVHLDDIRSRLQRDEALVEFVEFNQRYGAFFLGQAADLQWTDLGPAAPINLAIQDLITAANDWSVSLAGNEKRAAKSAEDTARDALRTLSGKLKPLMDWLAQSKEVRRLRVAPAGMFNLLPFAALMDARGRFMIEGYAISYLSASRDLVNPPGTSQAAGPPVIAVSPGASAGRTIAGVPSAIAFRADRLERLGNARAEARDLHRLMPGAQVLDEGEATEGRVKQLHRPSLLHIVGHGIVRGNEVCPAGSTSPQCQLAGVDAAARVMSLSAIVLEEAYGRGGRSTQDGMLTALELQTLDLQNSEMLVLSQCRMADGIPSAGEGVFGMRRAAAIAGVKTFVAPVWKVADATQRILMERFYKELSAGTGRAEALRRAQLQIFRNPASGNFLYWAPVILSGEPGPLPPGLFSTK